MPKHYLYFLLIITGFLLMEGGYNAGLILEQHGDEDSILHKFVTALHFEGILFGIIGLLELFLLVKQQCNTSTK